MKNTNENFVNDVGLERSTEYCAHLLTTMHSPTKENVRLAFGKLLVKALEASVGVFRLFIDAKLQQREMSLTVQDPR